MTKTRHPAKFSDPLLPIIAETLVEFGVGPGRTVIDPMAGTGKGVDYLRELGYEATGIELEPEWAAQSAHVVRGNALYYSNEATKHDALVTSPAYGNRMADNYGGDPKNSTRHTYRIYLGRKLSHDSGAALQWGAKYRSFHLAFLRDARYYVRELVIVNMKNHIRNHGEVDVIGWWIGAMKEVWPEGKLDIRYVSTPGQRHGQNGQARTEQEALLIMRVKR